MKGILYKPDMINAIVEGRKSVTRRLQGLQEINKEPDRYELTKPHIIASDGSFHWTDLSLKNAPASCGSGNVFAKPRFLPNEVVYIKEAWSPWADKGTQFYAGGKDEACLYKSDYVPELKSPLEIGGVEHWKSPLFMPEWAARYFIRIKDVRPERLQEITEHEAELEGMKCLWKGAYFGCLSGSPLRHYFMELWDSINPKTPWSSNPWVWVISFSIVDK